MKRLCLRTEPFFVYAVSNSPILYIDICVKGAGDMDFIRQKLLREEEAPHPLIDAIRDVCARIDAAQSRFEQEVDPDLIEAAIYELQSLRAKYRYLLRTARAEGIYCGEKVHLWHE